MTKFNRRQFFILDAAGIGTALVTNWVMGKETQPALQPLVSLF